jgi:hypothetical protein
MLRYEIIEERDSIPATTMYPEYEPDPKWKYVDSAGHEHVWVGNEIPTTYQAITGWAVCCEICNEATPTHETRCNLCDEPIEPGMVLVHAAGHTHYIAGNFEATLIVYRGKSTITYPVSPDEVKALNENPEVEIARVLANRQPISSVHKA